MKKKIIVALSVLVFVMFMMSGVTTAQKTTLYVWNPQSAVDVIPTHESLNRQFEKENPDIEIVMVTVPWGDMIKKLAPAVASSTEPDVAISQPQWLASLAYAGFVAQTDEIIQNIGEANFMQSYLKSHKMLDGHYYGVPHIISAGMLFYRIDLLEEAGIEPPTTWDELLPAAEKLTVDTNQDGRIDRYGMIYTVNNDASMYAWLESNDAHLFDEKGNVAFDSPRTVETIEFLMKLTKYAPPGMITYDFAATTNAIVFGNVAMAAHWCDFLIPVEREHPELLGKIGAGRMPKNRTQAGTTVGASLLIFKRRDNVAEASKYIEFLLRDDICTKYMQGGGAGWLPPIKTVYEDPNFWTVPPYSTWPDVYEVFLDNAKIGTTPGCEFETWPYVGEIITPDPFKEALGRVAGGENAERVVAESAAKMEEVVRLYKLYQE